MKEVYGFIEQLNSTSSRKDKEAMLASLEKESELYSCLAACVSNAYSTHIVFNIDKFDIPIITTNQNSLSDGLALVYDSLVEQSLRGDAAKDTLRTILSSMNSREEQDILVRVIKKDLRCGVGAKTWQKYFEVYVHPYMRCASFNEKNLSKLRYPCFVQTKLDGMYADFIDGIFITRNGLNMSTLTNAMDDAYGGTMNEFFNYIENGGGSSFVLQGELLVVDEKGEYLPREESNGYLNSDKIDFNLVRFVVWDVVGSKEFVQGTDKTPYKERFERLKTIVHDLHEIGITFINLVTNYQCSSAEQAMGVFEAHLKAGQEGVIFKNLSGVWKDGESKDQIKGKNIFECTLKITGFTPGEGKYTGMVGSLTCQSSDGILETGVSGFTDDMRKTLTDNIDSYIENGQLIQVKANSIVQDANSDMMSLFLPRFKSMRNDKTEADDLVRIKEQSASFSKVLGL